MALTNPQYDAIMRMYNERQLRHQREQQEHIRIAYEKIPRLAEIDAEIASLSVRKAKAMLNGDASMDLDLNAAIRDRSQERAALLSMHGYPADYLELTYDCPLCRDTGYINGTQKCACFEKSCRRSSVPAVQRGGASESRKFQPVLSGLLLGQPDQYRNTAHFPRGRCCRARKKARRSSAISARRLKISSFTATPVSEKRFFRTVLPAN